MKNNKKGFTLIELVVALAVFSVIIGTILSSFNFIYKINKSSNDEADAQASAQNLMRLIKNELQYAGTIIIEDNVDDSKNDSDYTSNNYIYLKDNNAYKSVNGVETLLSPDIKSDNFSCNLNFSNNGSNSKTVNVTINIIKNGTSIFSLTTTIYSNTLDLQGHTVIGIQGSSIKYTTTFATGPTINVSFINVSCDSTSISYPTTTMQMRATVYPSNASNIGIAWTVSDTRLAKIDQSSGLLTAMANGNVTVTATAKDGSGISATSSTITISNQPAKVTDFVISSNGGVSSVSVSSTLQINVGSWYPSAVPTSAQKVTWTVNNPSYATLSNITNTSCKLVPTGVSGVSVIITATSTDGWAVGKTLEIQITP